VKKGFNLHGNDFEIEKSPYFLRFVEIVRTKKKHTYKRGKIL
jgi:hypothetical protein